MSEFISHYFYRRAGSYVHISKLIPALDGGDNRMRELAKEIGMTYTNLSQVMNDAVREGLLQRTKRNNQYYSELTNKGKALCELCKGISVVIEQWDEEKTPRILKRMFVE